MLIISPRERNSFLFFVSKKEIAKKYPIIAEHSVCKNVAVANLESVVERVVANINFGPSPNVKSKIFSEAAKPKAEIII